MTIGGGWWGFQQLRKSPARTPMKASSFWWCIAWGFSLVAAVGFFVGYVDPQLNYIDASLGLALLLGGHQAMHIAQSKEQTERQRRCPHCGIETAEDIAARREALRGHKF